MITKRPDGKLIVKKTSDDEIATLFELSIKPEDEGAQGQENGVANKGGATATDIILLIDLVRNTVYDKFGVMLEPEVRII